MKQEILDDLSQYVASTILEQPGKVVNPDEALLSSGLIAASTSPAGLGRGNLLDFYRQALAG